MNWRSVEKDGQPPEMTMELWQQDLSPAHVVFCNDLWLFVGFRYNSTFYDGTLAEAMKNEGWVDDASHWIPVSELNPPFAAKKEGK